MAAEDDTDRLRVLGLDRGDVEAELESRAPPRHPHHAVTEALLGELLAVRGGGQRDSVGPVWNYYVQLLEHAGALVDDPILGIDV